MGYTVTHTREGHIFEAPHRTHDEVLTHVAELLKDLDDRDIPSITITRD